MKKVTFVRVLDIYLDASRLGKTTTIHPLFGG